MKRSILIVDDDAQVRTLVARALARTVAEVRTAESAEQALSILGASEPGVLLSDVRMAGMTGLDLLRLLRDRAPGVDVVLMSGHEDLPTVAMAMREGAVDFLAKPFDLHHLQRVVDKVFDDREQRALSPQPSAVAGGDGVSAERLVGRHPRMVDAYKLVGQAAGSRATVLIRGESGTGKELIARAIHTTSSAAAQPFVALNCTAMPASLLESELFGHVRGSFTGATADRRGRFALAGSGTIFLDEIGDTSPDFQAKLLRVLQEREFYPVGADKPERTDARVIAATHRNLERLVASGDFREDLYYRLRVIEISVPPLRERASDIPVLADHLIDKARRAAGRDPMILSRGALDVLTSHAWPGNVRELENCLTRAVVLATGDVIRPEHLAPAASAAPASAASARLVPLADVERDHVAHVLEATDGNKSRASRILGISRPRLDRLIEKYGIDASS